MHVVVVALIACSATFTAAVYVAMINPSFGVSRRKKLQILAGGVVANLVLTGLGILGCFLLPGGLYWGVFAAVNALGAIANALPLREVIGDAPIEAGHFAEIEGFGAELRRQAEAARQAAEDQRTAAIDPTRAGRERLRIAVVLLAINALAFAGGIFVLQSNSIINGSWWTWMLINIIILASFLGGSLFYLGLYFWKWLLTRGRYLALDPQVTRETPGTMLLAMTTMPWIVTVLHWGAGLFIRWAGW